MIRTAERRDLAAMLAIYTPFVLDTAVTMEYDPPTLEAFAARFDRVTARYPWLVWEEGGWVLGYAYADLALERAAYQWGADMSIYMAPEARHTGAAHTLYSRLEALMADLGYRRLYALITADNVASSRFHERRGYVLQGVLKKSGFKFGKWHDVYWYALTLGGDTPPEGPPKAFTDALSEN